MGGIIDGLKWGILLQLGVTVILPAVMGMVGNLGSLTGGQGGQGGRPQQMQQRGGGRPYGAGEW